MPGIGFIGLGIMGEGMAARLISQGVAGTAETPLVVWNRTPSKCQALCDAFPAAVVTVVDSAAAVVQACTVTYSMLSTPEASAAVFDAAESGTLAGVSAGKCIVDCATLAEADMQRMNQAVTAKGGYVSTHYTRSLMYLLHEFYSFSRRFDVSFFYFIVFRFLTHCHSRFLEAPVSGSKGPAAQGTLIFLCAGDQALFDEIKDNGLKAMGKASHFLGTDVGAGTRAKLVVNSLMGTMLAAYSEGLALSESVGLNPTTMVEIIGQGAIASPMYALKGPKMIQQDHAPNFPLKHAHKDMQLASAMAQAAGVEYSVMDTAEALFRKARASNDGALADLDFSAVFEQVHADSKSEFSKKRKAAP